MDLPFGIFYYNSIKDFVRKLVPERFLIEKVNSSDLNVNNKTINYIFVTTF